MKKSKIPLLGSPAQGFIDGILGYLNVVQNFGQPLHPAPHAEKGFVVSFDGDGPVEITQVSLSGVVQETCPWCAINDAMDQHFGQNWRN